MVSGTDTGTFQVRPHSVKSWDPPPSPAGGPGDPVLSLAAIKAAIQLPQLASCSHASGEGPSAHLYHSVRILRGCPSHLVSIAPSLEELRGTVRRIIRTSPMLPPAPILYAVTSQGCRAIQISLLEETSLYPGPSPQHLGQSLLPFV